MRPLKLEEKAPMKPSAGTRKAQWHYIFGCTPGSARAVARSCRCVARASPRQGGTAETKTEPERLRGVARGLAPGEHPRVCPGGCSAAGRLGQRDLDHDPGAGAHDAFDLGQAIQQL